MQIKNKYLEKNKVKNPYDLKLRKDRDVCRGKMLHPLRALTALMVALGSVFITYTVGP